MTREQRIEKFVLENGRPYIPAIRPSDIPQMKLNHCYDNCIQIVITNSKYEYCEGVVELKNGRRILHAWLTDGIRAYDPTWIAFKDGEEVAMPGTYIGFTMNLFKVAKFMGETEYAGVLANAWRSPKRAAACLKDLYPGFSEILEG